MPQDASAPQDRPPPTRAPERGDYRELKVILDLYELMLDLIQCCEKFPRHHRYSLGIAIKNRCGRFCRRLLA